MLFLLTLSFSSAVAGSETAAASDGLTGLVTEYANTHIPRGDLVVGVHDQDSVRWYTSGSLTPDTTFEIGSITKALTGMLLAEQIASGRVEPTTTVRELWPAGPQAAASGIPELPEHLARITLTQLATHTSGLPRLNLASWRFIRTFLHLDNPYAHLTTADMYRDAASASIEQPGSFRYSNLGFALLGRLLVEVAAPQTPSTAGFAAEYSDTVNEQVLSPLSLPEFMQGVATRLPDSYTANGRRATYWEFDGYAAAGGLTSTAADVLQFAKQLHQLRRGRSGTERHYRGVQQLRGFCRRTGPCDCPGPSCRAPARHYSPISMDYRCRAAPLDCGVHPGTDTFHNYAKISP